MEAGTNGGLRLFDSRFWRGVFCDGGGLARGAVPRLAPVAVNAEGGQVERSFHSRLEGLHEASKC